MQVGVYKVPVLFNRVRAVYTNTVPVDAYRGAGRPEASYVIERLMDKAARELKLGQDEIRKRNFVTAAEMPYSGGASLPFDSGDFERNITDAFNRADRSEEHTSELKSLMRISYAVFCLKKKKQQN